MSYQLHSRLNGLAPSLFFFTLLILSGCATQPMGPLPPIDGPVVDVEPDDDVIAPDEGDLDGQDDDPADIKTDSVVPEDDTASTGYTPPHMVGRDVFRAGVLLPFSDRRAPVRSEAEGMLAAIELALFEGFGQDFVLMPRDTLGRAEVAQQSAQELSELDADMIIGPLFSSSVIAIQPDLMLQERPIIAFSNDVRVAGNGVWLASMTPEAEVNQIVDFTYENGYDGFAFFGPDSERGRRIEMAMRQRVIVNGGVMIESGFYPAGSTGPVAEAERLAGVIAPLVERGRRIAILVPERGNRLRQIAPLLAFYGVDTRLVKMIGMSSWNDSEIWREPSLQGAWFPGPSPEKVEAFNRRYEVQYGQPPSSLAAIAYDATMLSIALAADGTLDDKELLSRDGFSGINGLFRFLPDGTAERRLAIMEIYPDPDSGGVRMVRPVPSRFNDTASE
ncbi:MAG: penicillin-binding protein activator [Henriciella sp.]